MLSRGAWLCLSQNDAFCSCPLLSAQHEPVNIHRSPRVQRGWSEHLIPRQPQHQGSPGPQPVAETAKAKPLPVAAGWVMSPLRPNVCLSGCTQCPMQNRPLSNSRLKLCLVNYSAARSRCFSVLIRRAWRWGKGKKTQKGKRKSSPGLQSS